MADNFLDAITELLSRQTELPTMATLLDPAAVAQALFVPAESVRLDYLRFKPNTSCLARFSIGEGRAARFAYGCCFGTNTNKANGRHDKTPSGGPRPLPLDTTSLLYEFPADPVLRGLARLQEADSRAVLLQRVGLTADTSIDPLPLAYKPERRCVMLAEDDGRSIVKFYRRADWPNALAAARLVNRRLPQIGQSLVGKSRQKSLLRFAYVEGEVLRGHPASNDESQRNLGQQLAAVHALPTAEAVGISVRPPMYERLAPIERLLVELLPEQQTRISRLRARLVANLRATPAQLALIHGDFYDKQVILTGDQARIIDFDQACFGDPREDLGNFIAHELLRGSDAPLQKWRALFDGYQTFSRWSLRNLNCFSAVALFALSHHAFRNAQPDWQSSTLRLLDRVEALIAESEGCYP